MKRASVYILLSLLLLCSLPSAASSPLLMPWTNAPKHEVRAVWLTTIGGIDWPHSYSQSARSAQKQQQELIDILDQLQRANINTILIQTRIRATTIYPSAIEPWDGCLSGFPGRSPGYDALQFCIEEAHRRGMEVQAWVVSMPVGRWDGAGCKALRRKHPELLRRIGSEGFMNPEREATGDYLAQLCREIVSRYDIDGINLDYIRYPDEWTIRGSRDKARQNITSIVRKVYNAVKEEKPWVKLSCSPIGKYSDLTRYWSHGYNARDKVGQDAEAWLSEGIMDELFPMMYFRGDQFYPFAIDWQESSAGRIICPGLGIYFLNPKYGQWQLEDVTREMSFLRQIGLGQAFYRSKFLTDNTRGLFDHAITFYPYPALLPPMTWQSSARPEAPRSAKVEWNDSCTLSWQQPAVIPQGGIYYNVYASREWPVDISDPRFLIAVKTASTSIVFHGNPGNLNYAITAIDRYGNESQPVAVRVQSTWSEHFQNCRQAGPLIKPTSKNKWK